ncbi:MAG: ATP-grasp domain-containing protein [Planctomycetota bacterium]
MDHPAKIYLIGASVRWPAQSLHQARQRGEIGGRTRIIAVDSFGDQDTLEHSDDWHPIDDSKPVGDGFVIAAGGHPRVLNWLNQSTSPSRAAWEFVEDRMNYPSLVQRTGFKLPPTPLIATEDSKHRWLLKSAKSSGGLGIVDAPLEQSAEALSFRDNTNDHLEAWIPGRRWGASFFSDGRRAILQGVCRSLIHHAEDLPFLYAGSYGPCNVTSSMQRTLSKLGNQVVERSQLQGGFGIDFLETRSNELFLLEINPRLTASMELIELAQETSFIQRILATSTDQLTGNAIKPNFPIPTARSPHWYKRVIYGSASGNIAPSRLAKIERRLDGTRWRLADLPSRVTKVDRSTPICTLIETGKSLANLAKSGWQRRAIVREIQSLIDRIA